MNIFKLKKNTEKAVKSLEDNKNNIATASAAIALATIAGAGFKAFNYFRREKNEDESAEIQRKTEENNRKIWLWSFATVAIEFLTNFVLR
jgi:uncharacterized protein HemX